MTRSRPMTFLASAVVIPLAALALGPAAAWRARDEMGSVDWEID